MHTRCRFLTFSLLLGSLGATVVHAQERTLLRTDVPPVVRGGRTLVPLRAVTEAFGSQVGWLPQSSEVVIKHGGDEIRLRVGSREARVNGRAVTLDVPAALEQGRVLVPLRFLGDQLGFPVRYEAATHSVLLTNTCGVKVLPLPSTRAGIVPLAPRPNQAITSPVRVHGQANVFEGTVVIQVQGPNGQVLGSGVGTGAMGSFNPFTANVAFTVPAGVTQGRVYLYSPGGRSENDVLYPASVPVRFR